jgi:receptor protein-tyrosine kinase
MAIALFLGLVLGVGAVFAAESLDNTVKTTEDVTALGLPALGFVPTLAAGQAQRTKRLLTSSLPRDSERRPVLAYSEARRFQARDWEAYRSIRTSILLSHSDKPPQAILVTSALPAEGKTTTASNIALALAQTGARTVLIDLDLRRPSLGPLFGIVGGQGMSTYLSGNSDLLPLVKETVFPSLWVVPSGPSAPNPAELVGSERMRVGIDELRRHFDKIVIDTPPSLELTDARVVSPHADGVILVTRSGKTPKEALRRLHERFTSVGATVLGALLNDVDFSSSSYGEYYHRYYGDYYGKTPVAESKKGA